MQNYKIPIRHLLFVILALLLYAVATKSCSAPAILQRRPCKSSAFLIPENERAPPASGNVAYSDFAKMQNMQMWFWQTPEAHLCTPHIAPDSLFILWQLWGARFVRMCLRQLPDHYCLISTFSKDQNYASNAWLANVFDCFMFFRKHLLSLMMWLECSPGPHFCLECMNLTWIMLLWRTAFCKIRTLMRGCRCDCL